MNDKQKTILLVEDEAILAMAESQMMKRHGYDVIIAISGEEAVEAVKREKGIDLILMDIDLGRGMDGTEAAELILKERHVPVMFLSSHTEPAVVEKTERVTSYGYVVKNSGETVLLAFIRMAFRLFMAHERIDHQREELESANEELQATIEELEASNEEFETANEELVRSEEELRLSEERYHSLYVTMNEGSCLHEIVYGDDGTPVDYRILDVNPRYEEITGLARAHVIGKLSSEIYGAGYPPYLDIYAETAATGEGKVFETYFKPMDRHFRVSVYSPETGKFDTVFQDITEWKRMEYAYREREELLSRTQEIAGVGSWTLDVESGILYWSEEVYRILGIKPSESGITFEAFLESIHPDDRQAVDEEYWKSVKENRDGYEIEHRVVRADTGEVRHVHEKCEHFRDEWGATVRSIGMVQDITDRKRLEEALRKSESAVRNKLSAILSPDGDLEALDLGDIIDVEAIQSLMDEFHRLTGIGIAILNIEGRVLVATGWQDICVKFHRVNPDTLRNCLESDIHLSGGVEPGTFRVYRCKNNMYDIATPLIIGKRHAGNLFLGQFFFEDESPDRGFFRRQASKYGFNEEEYLEALESVPRWSRETVDAVMKFYTKFAHIISTLSYGNIVLARIVSELDRVNEELRRSEELYRMLAENTSDVIWTADLNLKTTYVSPSVERLIGDTCEEHLMRTMEERFSEDDLAYLAEVFAEEMEKEKDPLCDRNRPRMVEVKHRRADGSDIWVEINMTAIRDNEGNMTGIQGVTRDISDRKRYERFMEDAFNEKKTLLRELQHRVKNSINMITSLIRLEQDRRGDASVRDALENIHGRVSVLSNLYGLLYTGDSMEIPTGEFLRNISENLSAAYSNRGNIRLRVSFDDVMINPRMASTLGLIVNELVTNAYKYAFPNEHDGAVRVELSRRDGELELLVADDGVGPPEGFNADSATGFGLELVRMLVQQIKGNFTFERNGETVFSVKWKEEG